MTRVGRAVEKGGTQGFMKVVVDEQTHQILGAAIFGVGGDEVVHAILDVMSTKAPYDTLARTMRSAGQQLSGDQGDAPAEVLAGSHIGAVHLIGVRVDVGLSAPAEPEPQPIQVVLGPVELFHPAGKPGLTQCRWCWAANTASDVNAANLSPHFAPEFVKPAATLSRHAPSRHRRPVCSANA